MSKTTQTTIEPLNIGDLVQIKGHPSAIYKVLEINHLEQIAISALGSKRIWNWFNPNELVKVTLDQIQRVIDAHADQLVDINNTMTALQRALNKKKNL